MKKVVSIACLIALAVGVSVFLAIKQRSKPPASSGPQTSSAQTSTKDEALKNALNLYATKKTEGSDFSNGPCLGIVAPDWVADIAHDPRQSIDDKVENQCADFREGRAHHFIELDPDGKLIKIYNR